jgi:hypothetical protein
MVVGDRLEPAALSSWLAGVSNQFGLAWWVEVITNQPHCTYYFGPFLSAQEAEQAKGGYIEDLEKESAHGIVANVKRCKPQKLTVY